MKPAICLEMIYPELEIGYKMNKVAEYGFQYVEFWDWRGKDVLNLVSACLETGIRIVNFSGSRKGNLVDPKTHDLFVSELKKAASVANQLDCSILTLLTNELGEDRSVKGMCEHLSPEQKYQNVRRGLERALDATPQSITLVLEPLNTQVDHPGYYLSNLETAVSLLREINHPRLKMLCDLYHLGVMGEELNAIINNYLEYIGHIHIADFPGRHEPGTGSAYWPVLLMLLKKKGYTGYVGFEYSPLHDTDESLKTIQTLWDRVIV